MFTGFLQKLSFKEILTASYHLPLNRAKYERLISHDKIITRGVLFTEIILISNKNKIIFKQKNKITLP